MGMTVVGLLALAVGAMVVIGVVIVIVVVVLRKPSAAPPPPVAQGPQMGQPYGQQPYSQPQAQEFGQYPNVEDPNRPPPPPT